MATRKKQPAPAKSKARNKTRNKSAPKRKTTTPDPAVTDAIAKLAFEADCAKAGTTIKAHLITNGNYADVRDAASDAALEVLKERAKQIAIDAVSIIASNAPAAPAKKPPGKPAVVPMTGKVCDAILKLYRSGKSITTACADVGIDRQRFYDFINEDENKHWKKLKDKAIEAHCDALLDLMQDACESDLDPQKTTARFRVLSWKLGRVLPKVYGDQVQKVAFTDPSGKKEANVGFVVVPAKEKMPA